MSRLGVIDVMLYSHLMNDCSLPFYKNSSFGSVHKIWWVKNCGFNMEVKDGLALEDVS